MTTLEAIYAGHQARPSAITAHLPRLRTLATGLPLAVEIGVKRGASSSALLLGAHRVVSYDIEEHPEARHLAEVAGDRWTYILADSRTVTIPVCDLLFIDSLHTYAQLDVELRLHADRARRYLVFHDTITFGSIGAKGETGEQAWAYQRGVSMPMTALGIRPAIDELQIRDPTWRLRAHALESHGLLILERHGG